MGIHPEGPSVIKEGGETLAALLDRNPSYLGRETLGTFGTLPYLFKFLAAAKPLSIQAHPNLEEAREGWERENRLGIPLTGANRNYKDPNHKPEILCALSPFTAMCGFRPLEEIGLLLKLFSARAPAPLGKILPGLLPSPSGPAPNAGILRNFLRTLLGLSPEERRALRKYAREGLREEFPGEWGKYGEVWDLCASFAELYPEDPAVISPLYLNLVNLAPGEAVYLPAGVLHAYVKGFGVELMANSDNVLRGGLSPKYIDIDELLRILNFSAGKPAILKPPEPRAEEEDAPCSCYTYPAPCREFSLSVLRCRNGRGSVPGRGPRILAVTEGRAALCGDGGEEEFILEKGETAFVPAREAGPPLSFSGTCTIYVAGTGDEPGP
jgi:mannose-6-phosphate isomerase